jgi:hypothetical protein
MTFEFHETSQNTVYSIVLIIVYRSSVQYSLPRRCLYYPASIIPCSFRSATVETILRQQSEKNNIDDSRNNIDSWNNTDESRNNTDDSRNNIDDSGNNTDDNRNNTDDSRHNTDNSWNNTDDSQNNTNDSRYNTDESGNNNDDSGNNTDDSQNSTDESRNNNAWVGTMLMTIGTRKFFLARTKLLSHRDKTLHNIMQGGGNSFMGDL